MPAAGETGSVQRRIETIGSGKDATWSIGPAIAIIAALFQVWCGYFLVSGIVVDNGNGTVGSGEFVIVKFIVLGVGYIKV